MLDTRADSALPCCVTTTDTRRLQLPGPARPRQTLGRSHDQYQRLRPSKSASIASHKTTLPTASTTHGFLTLTDATVQPEVRVFAGCRRRLLQISGLVECTAAAFAPPFLLRRPNVAFMCMPKAAAIKCRMERVSTSVQTSTGLSVRTSCCTPYFVDQRFPVDSLELAERVQ